MTVPFLKDWTALDPLSIDKELYFLHQIIMKRDYLKDWHVKIVSIFYQQI